MLNMLKFPFIFYRLILGLKLYLFTMTFLDLKRMPVVQPANQIFLSLRISFKCFSSSSSTVNTDGLSDDDAIVAIIVSQSSSLSFFQLHTIRVINLMIANYLTTTKAEYVNLAYKMLILSPTIFLSSARPVFLSKVFFLI